MDNNNWIQKEITAQSLSAYLNRQLNHFFPDESKHLADIEKICSDALDKMKFSIAHIKLRGFTSFHYLHSDLYAQFVYYMSHLAWKKLENTSLASKLFYLNKALHGFNCMYDTILPDIFLFTHPVGSVIGKASYSNFLVICQNVTIGMHKGQTPVLGENIFLATQSVILGNSVLEGHCSVSAASVVIDEKISAHKTIIGKSPDLIVKDQKRDILGEMYFIR